MKRHIICLSPFANLELFIGISQPCRERCERDERGFLFLQMFRRSEHTAIHLYRSEQSHETSPVRS